MASIRCVPFWPAPPPFKSYINNYYRSDLFEILRDNLPLNLYTSLASGFLKAIVTMGDSLKFSGQLVHFIVWHEVKTKKEYEMWFKVCNHVARFSIVEFAAITGLNCNEPEDIDLPKVDPESELGLSHLTFDDLVDVFIRETNMEKKLRWAYVLVVDSVLLPRRRNSVISPFVYALSSDLDAFCKYPWGRNCYLDLINSLQYFNRKEHNCNVSRFGYNVNGYPLAFQVWILETFPDFIPVSGVQHIGERSIPFLSQWSSKPKANNAQLVDIEDSVRTKHFKCNFPLTSDFGNLITLKFGTERADPVFDDYIAQALSSTSSVVDGVITNVVRDLMEHDADLDNFDLSSKHRPRKKMLTIGWIKHKDDCAGTSSAVEDRGVKRKTVSKVDEDEPIAKRISNQSKSTVLEKKEDAKKRTKVDKDVVSKKHIPASTSQIMRKLKHPVDGNVPVVGAATGAPSLGDVNANLLILLDKIDAHTKLLGDVKWKLADHSLRLQELKEDVKDIKSILGRPDAETSDGVILMDPVQKHDVVDKEDVLGGEEVDITKVGESNVIESHEIVERLVPIPEKRSQSDGNTIVNVTEVEEQCTNSEKIPSVSPSNSERDVKPDEKPDVKPDDNPLLNDLITTGADKEENVVGGKEEEPSAVVGQVLINTDDDNKAVITEEKNCDATEGNEGDDKEEDGVDAKEEDPSAVVGQDLITTVDDNKTVIIQEKKCDATEGNEGNLVGNDENQIVRRSNRLMKSSAVINSPYTQEKKLTIPKKPAFSFYDESMRKPFYEWYKGAPKDAVVRGCEVNHNKEFFQRLLIVSKWCGDDHLEEALFYMRKKVLAEPAKYKNIVFVDWTWYKRFNHETLGKYKYGLAQIPQEMFAFMDGSRPEFYGKSWYHDVQRVYSPMFIPEKEHFLALEIDLRYSTIRVFDCLINLCTDEEIQKALEPIATLLPILMKRTDKFDYPGWVGGDFTVFRDKSVPQDGLGGNCCIYTMKYLEHFGLGTSIEDLDDLHMKAHREKIAIDIFNQEWVFKELPSKK